MTTSGQRLLNINLEDFGISELVFNSARTVKRFRQNEKGYFFSEEELNTLEKICSTRTLPQIASMMEAKGFPARSQGAYINNMLDKGWEWVRMKKIPVKSSKPEIILLKKCYERGMKLDHIVKVLQRRGFPARSKKTIKGMALNRKFKRPEHYEG